MVQFHGTYHAILGCLCYAKFMDVPNYTYLKLKMPGPSEVITVDTSFQCAYKCEVECCDHTTTIIASKELATIRKEVAEETHDHQQLAMSFEPVEGAKEVLIDLAAPKAKWCALAPRFPPNRKARSLTSFAPTKTSLRGNPRTC